MANKTIEVNFQISKVSSALATIAEASNLPMMNYNGKAGATGYYETVANETPVSEPHAFKDEHGRIGVVFPLFVGNLVIFTRHSIIDGPVVVNLPKKFGFLTHLWGMDNTMSKEVFRNLFGFFYFDQTVQVNPEYQNWPVARMTLAMC